MGDRQAEKGSVSSVALNSLCRRLLPTKKSGDEGVQGWGGDRRHNRYNIRGETSLQ